ncbi:NTF2-like protein, partial [Delitschia confertaspora ATCC 74209]
YVDTIPPRVLEHLHSRPYIKAIVSHSGTTSIPSPSDSSHSIPHLLHIPGSGPESLPASDTGNIKKYTYPSAAPNSSHWILPAAEEYDSASANIAHTRSLEFLKPVLGGPHFDIEAVWEEHTKFEFVERDVAATMATMVAQPYVNHIPTMTGGVGKDRLTAFYTHHFIHSNPPDTRLRLLSRSISINRIIDEFLLELTHTSTVDWLLPSLPPTNRPLSIPMTSIVTLRGDKLCHEHISWDQGTVLMQLGLMPQWLKFPYEIDTGGVGGTRKAREGERFEVRTPCVGMEGSRKAVDEMEGESNVLIKKGREEGYWREVEDI